MGQLCKNLINNNFDIEGKLMKLKKFIAVIGVMSILTVEQSISAFAGAHFVVGAPTVISASITNTGGYSANIKANMSSDYTTYYLCLNEHITYKTTYGEIKSSPTYYSMSTNRTSSYTFAPTFSESSKKAASFEYAYVSGSYKTNVNDTPSPVATQKTPMN